MSFDRFAGAKLLDLEIDVEQLELTQETSAQAATTSAATATRTTSARRTATTTPAEATPAAAASTAAASCRVTRRTAATTAAPAHHAAERHNRRTTEGIVGGRESFGVRVLNPDFARVERDEEVVGRHALRGRRVGEEFDARVITRGLSATAHDFIVLTARRVAGINLRGRRDAERNSGLEVRSRHVRAPPGVDKPRTNEAERGESACRQKSKGHQLVSVMCSRCAFYTRRGQ